MIQVISVLVLFIYTCSAGIIGGPLHASCKLDWNVGMNCKAAGQTIVDQINKWKGDDCGTGEKCLYSLDSFDGKILKAKHETPKAHYIDDLTMVFNDNGDDCAINANSTSETWYAVLDYGTNYCNLHNLITGSGLDKTARFKEDTSDSVCTQFSSANCEKY
ncbi:hypothetical protein PoB_003177800 [Plakobranchus ocellatus]|uniref:Uncharacterized protein n=1 Tax=Plakobranchus ocellatus TaxID=259542 RepID=A0AAV4ADD6_9GAST|nr:hypothetical protein PoB_003177800 [Plakobranchus ocellatus]